jgi:hypothetical protein
MATQNTKPFKPTRVCRQCKKPVLVENFQTHRIKTCIPCQIKRRRDAVVFNEHLRTLEPAPTGPALTSALDGMRKYKRDYARERAGPATPPLVTPTTKLCRRCQTRKPLSAFGSWRIRVCLDCDGPTLESLLRR